MVCVCGWVDDFLRLPSPLKCEVMSCSKARSSQSMPVIYWALVPGCDRVQMD